LGVARVRKKAGSDVHRVIRYGTIGGALGVLGGIVGDVVRVQVIGVMGMIISVKWTVTLACLGVWDGVFVALMYGMPQLPPYRDRKLVGLTAMWVAVAIALGTWLIMRRFLGWERETSVICAVLNGVVGAGLGIWVIRNAFSGKTNELGANCN
jgi:energy-converting hydrogenase Eha subunit A